MIDQARLDKWREMARSAAWPAFDRAEVREMLDEIDRLRSIIGKLDDERKQEFFAANPGL
jgi:hypothetical protein